MSASDSEKLIEELTITYEAFVELKGSNLKEALQDAIQEADDAAVRAAASAALGAATGAATGILGALL